LPVAVALLGVPANAQLTFDAQTSSTRPLATGVTLCVGQRQTAEPAEEVDGVLLPPASQTTFDPAVYGQDAFYPKANVRLVDLGFARSQRIVRLEFFPVQFNPATGELRVTDSIRATIRYDGAEPAAAESDPATEPAAFEAALARTLLNYDAARNARGSAAAATAFVDVAWTPPQPGYKIALRAEGMYQLTRNSLAAAGIPVDTLDPRTIRMFNAGQQVAIRVTGEGDGKFDAGDQVLFFGKAIDTRYTDVNVYWITYGGAPGLRMGSRTSLDGGALATSFPATAEKEDNTTYDSDLPMQRDHDHWWGQQISAVGANKAASINVSLATPEAVGAASDAQLSVLLGGVTTGAHHVRLYINPSTNPVAIWDGTFDGQTIQTVSATLPASRLNPSGNNTVKIELINDVSGRPADILRLDWVRISYPRSFSTLDGGLTFRSDTTGARRYEIGPFAGNVDLYDVTDPAQVAQITGASLAAPGLRFGDNQPALRQYAALEQTRYLAPLAITADQPSSLQGGAQGADYIIITHADFLTAIQPLADFRAGQSHAGQKLFLPLVMRPGAPTASGSAVAASIASGMTRVKVVDVQDIYDEFGGGLMSAEAIRDFIRHTYDNWQKPAPRAVLLVGDGTYDLRRYKSQTPTFIPPYLDLVDPDAGETVADNRFVAVTPGDILPDLDIGRLPVNTPGETTAMVNKIIAYETQPAAAWQKKVAFVSDDLETGGGNFYEYSNKLADGFTNYRGKSVKIVPTNYTTSKIYLGQTCDLGNPATSSQCRAQIVDQINAGALMISYIGHGVSTYWAAERLYDAAALANVNNPDRLPIMLPMTCNEGYFIDPAESSLSELGVRAENRGAVASWSATGYGLAPGHDLLERGLFLSVFYDDATLGGGTTAAKLYLVATAGPGQYVDLIDTFLLLGDPGLKVP
jgi:hypothetical protein